MRRVLFFNNIASAGSIFWRILTQLLVPPILITMWGVGQYGEWLLIAAIPLFLSNADFGFTSAASSDMTMEVARNNQKLVNAVFQSIYVLTVCLSLLIVIVSSVLLWPDQITIGSLIFTKSSLLAAYCFSYYTAFVFVSKLFLGCLRSGRGYAFSTITYDIIQSFEDFSLVVAAYCGLSFAKCAMIITLIRIINVVVLFFIVRQRMPWLKFGLEYARLAEIRRLLVPAFAALAIPLALAFNFQGMVWIAGVFISPAAAAILNTTRTASRIITQLIGIFSRAAMPIYSASVATEDESAGKIIVELNSFLTVFVLLPGCALFAVFGAQVIALWTHGLIVPSWTLVALVALATTFHSVWYFYSNFLLSINRHVRLAVLMTPLTLIFLVIAVPASRGFGIDGIAATTAALEIAIVIGCFVLYAECSNPFRDAIRFQGRLFQILRHQLRPRV
jgi:O-antigen/teichoic acid export membrane protein